MTLPNYNTADESITTEILRARASQQVYSSKTGITVLVLYIVAFPIGIGFFLGSAALLGESGGIAGAIGGFAVGVALFILGRRLHNQEYLRRLTLQLEIHRGLRCVCGYPLDTIREKRCPECGKPSERSMLVPTTLNVLAHGIDLIEVDRIAGMVKRHGDHFLQRVFTEHERNYAKGSKRCTEHLAARFAAKEAVMKALGTGWRNGIAWTDIEVVSLDSGAPTVSLHGQAQRIASQLGIQRWLVSLTHTQHSAMASVTAAGNDTSESENHR